MRPGDSEGMMTDPRVQILDKTVCYDGFFRIERYRLRHELHLRQEPALDMRVLMRRQDALPHAADAPARTLPALRSRALQRRQ